MTYDEYAGKLNAHADACATCDASRKMNTVTAVCAEAQVIVDEWKAFAEKEREEFFNKIKSLTEQPDVPQS